MHKAFISYHHRNDQWYKDELVRMNTLYNIFIDRSVKIGDISDDLDSQAIRRKIRDERLRDSTVTILLLGTETRYRKHVDWELKSSMIDGLYNKRSGILVVTLPSTNCNSWHTCYPEEKALIYPECASWFHVESKADYRELYPTMPQRIIDNLTKPGVKISVVPWHKIANDPSNLAFLIRETSKAGRFNEYDLSLPMRRRDHIPTLLGGLFGEVA